MVFRRKSFV